MAVSKDIDALLADVLGPLERISEALPQLPLSPPWLRNMPVAARMAEICSALGCAIQWDEHRFQVVYRGLTTHMLFDPNDPAFVVLVTEDVSPIQPGQQRFAAERAILETMGNVKCAYPCLKDGFLDARLDLLVPSPEALNESYVTRVLSMLSRQYLVLAEAYARATGTLEAEANSPRH